MATAEVNGITLRYEVQGNGPELLLIGGLGASSLAWATVIPHLRDRFTCITFDNRGTGMSSVPTGPYSIAEMADDTAALIDHLGLRSVLAVGWSLGASVLQSSLIRHGEKFRRAVLLNAFPSYTTVQHSWLDALLILRRNGLDPASLAIQGMPWGFTSRVLSDHVAVAAQAELVHQDPHPTSLQGFEAQAAGLRIYDARPRLGEVSTPTLVLTGAEDVLTPVAQSIEIAALLQHGTLRVLPRGGHGMVLEYPEDTVHALVDYLTT